MATKTAYQRDEAGIYIGSVTAFESPLEPGVFHLPGGCTFDAPPTLGDRQAAVWRDDGWHVETDRRGEIWYDGRLPVTVDFLGDPGERGLAPTPEQPTLVDLRAAKIVAIGDRSAALLSAGAPVDNGLHVALDDGSRADLTAMAATASAALASGLVWPDSYARGWITIENQRIPLPSPIEGLSLAAAVGDWYAAIVQHRRDLKDAVLAAIDAAALDAIDITAGWPT